MTDSKALFMICRENDIVKMRQALAGGFNPNQRLNESGIKALHIVASRGHQEMVSPLRLPQVFYNQGLSSLCRCVSYVGAEH